jgi:hypothetical protein
MSDQAPCPRCRHANPPENRFCGSCGASLGAGNDLVAQRGGTPTVKSRALPAKLGPAGNAVAVGLAALALRAGLSWLGRRTAVEARPSTSTARTSGTAVFERLLAQGLEEVLIEELEAGRRSRAFTWQAIRSIVVTETIDRQSRG